MSLHVCKSEDVEAPPKEAEVVEYKPQSLREELLALWSVYRMATTWPRWIRKAKDLEVLLYYGIEVPSTKRRVPVDVARMVEDWKKVFVTLCTSHDKDQIDAAEYQMDELLLPILKAPVAQLREFYVGLRDALKADERVPFFVWSMFKAWGEVVAEKASDKPTQQRLHKALAKEVANLVEDQVKGDITEAIVGALMWRDPPTLRQIKEDLQTGAKPRLRGRESCLFLVTERGRGKNTRELHKVML